jgi:hypothetical protein
MSPDPLPSSRVGSGDETKHWHEVTRLYNQETVPMSPDPSPRGDLGLGTRLGLAGLVREVT